MNHLYRKSATAALVQEPSPALPVHMVTVQNPSRTCITKLQIMDRTDKDKTVCAAWSHNVDPRIRIIN